MNSDDKLLDRARKAGRFSERTCPYCRAADWGTYSYEEEGRVLRRTCAECGYFDEFDSEILSRCTKFDEVLLD